MARKNVKTRRPTIALTLDDVDRLLAVVSPSSISGMRYRAWIALCFRSGLRLQESLDLVPGDVDLRTGSGVVRSGKGGKTRHFRIPADALGLLQIWLERRAKLAKERGWSSKASPIFCRTSGKPMSKNAPEAFLRRMGERAGIDKPVRPHGLRAGHAVDLIDRGHNLNAVRTALGHSRITTTAVYLADLGGEAHMEAQGTVEQDLACAPRPVAGPPPPGPTGWELELLKSMHSENLRLAAAALKNQEQIDRQQAQLEQAQEQIKQLIERTAIG